MGESLFQKLDRSEVEAAAADAQAWGFPREIRPEELAWADWFRMGPNVVFWIEHYDISPTYFPHVAVHPDVRSKWGPFAWMRALEDYARGQGAEELGFITGPGYEENETFLRRNGFTDTDYGLCKPLHQGAA